jgi:hypothetical protein
VASTLLCPLHTIPLNTTTLWSRFYYCPHIIGKNPQSTERPTNLSKSNKANRWQKQLQSPNTYLCYSATYRLVVTVSAPIPVTVITSLFTLVITSICHLRKIAKQYCGQETRLPPTTMCWWGCGEKGTLVHCWWECKLVQPL